MRFSETSYYKGSFENGQYSGSGIRRFDSGDLYIGDWREGKQEGHGLFLWVEKDQVYEGEWLSGLMSGEGMYVYYERPEEPYLSDDPEETVIGRFKQYAEQKCTAQAIRTVHHVGEYRAGLRHGPGTFYYVDGNRLTGVWSDNVKDGEYTLDGRDGSTATVIYDNDVEVSRDPSAAPPKSGLASALPDEARAVSVEGDAIHHVATVGAAALDAMREVYQSQYSRMSEGERELAAADVTNVYIRQLPALLGLITDISHTYRAPTPPLAPPLPTLVVASAAAELGLARTGLYSLTNMPAPRPPADLLPFDFLHDTVTPVVRSARHGRTITDAVTIGLDRLTAPMVDHPVYTWLGDVIVHGIPNPAWSMVGWPVRRVLATIKASTLEADVGNPATGPAQRRSAAEDVLGYLGVEVDDSTVADLMGLPCSVNMSLVLLGGMARGPGEGRPTPGELGDWIAALEL